MGLCRHTRVWRPVEVEALSKGLAWQRLNKAKTAAPCVAGRQHTKMAALGPCWVLFLGGSYAGTHTRTDCAVYGHLRCCLSPDPIYNEYCLPAGCLAAQHCTAPHLQTSWRTCMQLESCLI